MPRPSLRATLLLIGLPALLLACGDKESTGSSDKGGDEGADGADGADGTDGADGADGGGDTSPPSAPTFTLEAVADVLPATLPAEEGGALTVHLHMSAADEEGAVLALDTAIAGVVFKATFSDGSTTTAEASVEAEGLLVLTFTAPGGLAGPGGARSRIQLSADGADLGEVAVGLSVDPTALLASFTGDTTGHVDRTGFTGETCHVGVVDADDDGVLEVITLSVEGSTVTASGCVPKTSGDETDWECVGEVLEVDIKSGDSLLCGSTDHFRLADDAGVAVAAALGSVEGALVEVGGLTWTGGAWSGSGGSVVSSALFAVVLGLNTTKSDPAVPLDAMLRLSSGGGSWTGEYDDGKEPWAWTTIGAVTPSAVGGGKAWAGFFTDRDLSDLEGGSGAVYAWAIDPSALASGGKLTVTAASPNASAKAFSRLRDISFEGPGFTIEAATAAGEDLDGDGHPELFVEAWGEGRYAAWLILDATDKSASTPVRRLLPSFGDETVVTAPVLVQADGSSVVTPSSFRRRGNKWFNAEVNTTRIQLICHNGEGYPNFERLSETWDIDEAIAAETLTVRASEGGTAGSLAARKVPPTAGQHGMCAFGKCFCVPGFSGRSRVERPSGGGSSVIDAAEGELLFAAEDPSGEALLLAQSPDGGEWAQAALLDQEGGLLSAGLAWGTDGYAVTLDGAPFVSASPSATFTLRLDAAGMEPAAFVFEPEVSAAAGVGDPATPVTIRATVRVRYQDVEGQGALPPETSTGGTTTPVVLSDRLSAEGGALLAWRDGEGQTWLGVLDVEGMADLDGETLPFLQGPVAVGAPLDDPDGELALGADHQGMIGLSTRIIADTPFLSMEDLERRVASWDTPMEVPFTSLDPLYDAALLVAGDGAGGNQLLFLPAFDDLLDLAPIVVSAAGASNLELAVPRLLSSLLPDAPPVLVSVNGQGEVVLDLFDSVGPLAQERGLATLDLETEDGLAVALSGGDVNGDGIGDLIAGSGRQATALLMDGHGGVLGGPAVEGRVFTNFALLLNGGSADRSCALDADGGGGATWGAPILGAGR